MTIKRPEKQSIGGGKSDITRRKTTINQPQIDRILYPDGIENPLEDVDYGDGDIANTDLRQVAEAEEGAVLKALKESEKSDKRRFEVAVDSEFWCALYFQSRAQKEAFLTAMGWLMYGDKYINGLQLADHQNITLPEEQLQATIRGSAKLAERSTDLGKEIPD